MFYTHLYTGSLYRIHVTNTAFISFIFCLQVTPPESVTPRYYHSITATSLGPGLTEVLVFGRWSNGSIVAETTILRFGEQLLVHVAMATHCLIDKYTQYMCQ